jgi:hypothetical protein
MTAAASMVEIRMDRFIGYPPGGNAGVHAKTEP